MLIETLDENEISVSLSILKIESKNYIQIEYLSLNYSCV